MTMTMSMIFYKLQLQAKQMTIGDEFGSEPN